MLKCSAIIQSDFKYDFSYHKKKDILSPQYYIILSLPLLESQYMLRLFFWKDMLARKKRENKLDDPTITTTASENAPKFKIIKKETRKTRIQGSPLSLLPVSQSLPTQTNLELEKSSNTKKSKQQISIIRSKRSQADDEWPISYKGDSAKRGFITRKREVANFSNLTTSKNKEQTKKRDKRLILDNVEMKFEDNRNKKSTNSNYSSLFNGLKNNKMPNKRDNEHVHNTSPNIDFHQKIIKLNINGQEEEILHRSKRIGDS